MAKEIGLRQKVKSGAMTAHAAFAQVMNFEFKSRTIVNWLASRIKRGVVVTLPVPPASEKEPSKSEAKRLKIQQKK